jgi:tripartite-type tricarboxylate transporter receptor subunit TctC
VPGYEASAFFGLVAPKGTPPEIVARINKLVNDALKDPAILKKVKEYGGIPMAGSAEEFGKVLTSETDKWGKVVHAANLSIE